MKHIINKLQHNILTTNDITTADRRSLSELLDQQSQEIHSLKSNVKWIYKYGGVGSGGTGGGGSAEEAAPWKYVISLDGVTYQKDGDTAYFGNPGDYTLGITFYKVQGRTFYVKITYKSRGKTELVSLQVPPTGNNEIAKTLYLDSNDVMSIVISDDEGNVSTFNLNYVTRSYEISAQYVYADTKEPYILEDYNMYVTAVKERGVEVEITCAIVVPFEEAILEYTNWSGSTEIISHEDGAILMGKNIIYKPVGIEISGDNAGYYQALVNPKIKLANSLSYELLDRLDLSCNLIPDFCYLKVQSEATLYATPQEEGLKYSNTGQIVLQVTPYQRYIDKTKLFDLSVELIKTPFADDEEGEITTSVIDVQLLDRVEYPLRIPAPDPGLYEINLTLSRNNEPYYKTYYLYVRIPVSNFNWFPLNKQETIIKPLLSNLYVFNKPAHQQSNEPVNLVGDRMELISRTMQDTTSIVYPLTRCGDEQTTDILINIALNYNSINDVNNPIIEFDDTGDAARTMVIYQDRILMLGLHEANIYIPKDNKYHLLSIYKRAIKKVGLDVYYETCVYIDGVLEPCFKTMYATASERWDLVTFDPGNYSVEYLEVSYYAHPENNKTYFYDQTRTYFNDTDVLFHYYSYCDLFEKFPEGYLDTFKDVYNIAKDMEIDNENSRIKVSLDVINNIALTLEVPVLMIEYLDETKKLPEGQAGSLFLSWMESRYNVQGSGAYTEKPRILNSVWYSKGKLELREVSVDTTKYYFSLDLLGTSTMLYGAKNYDLILNTNESYIALDGNENKKFVYSFNFLDNDPTTFLPETRFTLKADVVDSSHSNNATIGKFVNEVTTPFNDARRNQSGNMYAPYIKNTLQGFPVLLFMKNTYYIGESASPTSDFYYMGIYSFNLGRDSEYNLGYRNLGVFLNAQGASILSANKYIIEVDGRDVYVDGFGVAEVLENQPYFDFSLYDNSILFQSGQSTGYAMFAKYKSANIDNLKSWLSSMVSDVANAGGYIFETVLSKNMLTSEELPNISYLTGYKYKIPLNIVGNYRTLLVMTTTGTDLTFSKKAEIPEATLDNVQAALVPDLEQERVNSIDYASLSEYYVVCMALGLVDSVQKNMNLKTWNGKTFYTAFYDMDTSLGKDNAGNNTDPVAFSDYWKAEEAEEKGELVLKLATLYRDWYDPDISGFDIPSHYLFALAKYAPMVLSDDNIQRFYPNNVWARFRRSNDYPINDSGYEFVSKSLGCLRNADFFVDTYYGNYLSKVSDLLFNFNYRKKYLTIQTSAGLPTYNSDNAKFGGKRVYYVRDWLNSRFHLLDLYFGINPSIVDPVNVCTITEYDEHGYPISGTWSYKKDYNNNALQYPTVRELYTDQNNEDILILSSAFSQELTAKYSSNIAVKIQSEDYSPMVLSGALQGRYIVDSSAKLYKIEIESIGKAAGFGGSKNWVYLSNINPFIYGSNFYLNNNKMLELNGLGVTEYNIAPQACTQWDLNAPSLKTINLNYSKYSGTLEINGNVKDWVNITDVNIDNSLLSLKVMNVPVVNVSANSVINHTAYLQVSNCDKLESLSYNNAQLDALTFSVPFNKNPNSKYVSLNRSRIHNGSSFVSGTNSNFAIAKKIQINCTTNDGEIDISGLNLTSAGLYDLTLKGFKKIYISNCNYLSKINITNPETVTVLEVTSCASKASKLSINSDDKIDLSGFINLLEINFNNTLNFTECTLPTTSNGVLLKQSAFYNTSLTYLNGGAARFGTNNSSIFKQSKYTLRQSAGGALTEFKFPTSGALTFTETFYDLRNDTALTPETYYDFHNKYQNGIALISSAQSMWGGAKTLGSYNFEKMKADSKGLISIGWYTGIQSNNTDVNGVLNGANAIAALHKNFFKISNKTFGGGKQVKIGGTLLGRFGNPSDGIHVLLSCFKPIADNLSSFSMTIHSPFTVVSDTNTSISSLKLSSLLCNGKASPITSLTGIRFNSELEVDLANFSEDFPNLTYINLCFTSGKARNIFYKKDDKVIGFLYGLTSTKNITCSWSFNFETISQYSNYEDELRGNKPSFKDFINWEKCYKTFSCDLNTDFYINFTFPKYIYGLEDFNYILETAIDNSDGSLGGLFYKAEVYLSENDYTDDLELKYVECSNLETPNTSITSIKGLFRYMNFYDLNNQSIHVKFDWNLFKKLPNIYNIIYAFENVKIDDSIPFDLFKRRSLSNEEIILRFNSKRVTFTLYKYIYNATIQYMLGCFLNCKFKVPYFDHTKVKDVESDYIMYNNVKYNHTNFDTFKLLLTSDLGITDFSSYSNLNWWIAEPNKELLGFDLLDTAGYTDYYEDGLSGFYTYNLAGGGTSIYNYYKNTQGDEFIDKSDETNYKHNYRHYILSPDIFYSCTNGANLSSVFNNCLLFGIIPDNLFKGNCITPTLANFLDKSILFPKFYKTVYDRENNITSAFNVYYYLPDYFVKSESLVNSFYKCRLCLPYSYSVAVSNNNIQNRTLYVFAFRYVDLDAVNIAGFLPTYVNQTVNKNTAAAIAENNNIGICRKLGTSYVGGINLRVIPANLETDDKVNRITINSMYDKTNEGYCILDSKNDLIDVYPNENGYEIHLKLTLDGLNYSYVDKNYITHTVTKEEDLWFENGVEVTVITEGGFDKIVLPVNSEDVKSKLGRLGLIFEKKNTFYYEVLQGIWLQFGYGHLLGKGIKFDSSLNLSNRWLIKNSYYNDTSNVYGISPDLKFPSMYSGVSNSIVNNPKYWSSTPVYVKISGEQIEDFSNSVKNAYNASATYKDNDNLTNEQLVD